VVGSEAVPPAPSGPDDAAAALARDRLELLSDEDAEDPDRAVFEIACRGCGFLGEDGSFLAFPSSTYESAAELRDLVSHLLLEHRSRKCPRCHAQVELRGLRVHALAPSARVDLVASSSGGACRLEAVPISGPVEELGFDDPRLAGFPLDSKVRAAATLMAFGEEARAEEMLAEILDARPEDVPSRARLATLRARRGDYASAAQLLHAAQEPPDPAHGFHLRLGQVLGEIALASGDPAHGAKARAWLRRASDTAHADPAVRLLLGRLEAQAGWLGVARGHLRAAMGDEETATLAGMELAELELRSGRPAIACRIAGELVSAGAPGTALLELWRRAARMAGDEDAARRAEAALRAAGQAARAAAPRQRPEP
jgi:Tfp pilus assembly protein PilF